MHRRNRLSASFPPHFPVTWIQKLKIWSPGEEGLICLLVETVWCLGHDGHLINIYGRSLLEDLVSSDPVGSFHGCPEPSPHICVLVLGTKIDLTESLSLGGALRLDGGQNLIEKNLHTLMAEEML